MVSDMESIDATTLRRELRTVLDRAYVHGEPTMVTRHGAVIAVVIPAEMLAEFDRLGILATVQPGTGTAAR